MDDLYYVCCTKGVSFEVKKNLFLSTPLKDTVKFIKNFKFVGNQLKMSIYCYFIGFY